MKEEIQIFVGNNGLDLKDFYPDDLPKEWRFDYYENNHNAIMVKCSEDIDFEEVLEDIGDDFKLIIDISESQNIGFLLKNIHKQENLIIYSNNDKYYKDIKNYNFCIQSDKKIPKTKNIDNWHFNDFFITIKCSPKDNKEAKNDIENTAKLSTNSVIIYNQIDTEILTDAKIVSELLGFSNKI
jgi:hypothetical protein